MNMVIEFFFAWLHDHAKTWKEVPMYRPVVIAILCFLIVIMMFQLRNGNLVSALMVPLYFVGGGMIGKLLFRKLR